jgi:hypothetical protein
MVLCLVVSVKFGFAARFCTQIYDENIRTLQVLPNGEVLQKPCIELNSADEIVVSFDELGYEASNFYIK